MQRYTAPSQRDVPVSLYTSSGWIVGAFMIPSLRNLVDYSNQEHDFFKLKSVRLPGLDREIPFFALQRRSVILMIPSSSEQSVRTTLAGNRIEKDVSCAFPNGIVSGKLTVMEGIRVSDFIMQKTPFFPLTDCSLFIRAAKPEIRRDVPMVLVSRSQIIGISEPRIV